MIRVLVFAVLSAVVNPVDGHQKPKAVGEPSDHQKIQGSWQAVTLSTGPGKEDHVVFSGNKVSWQVGGNTLEGTFVIDATRQPKRIDFKFSGQKDGSAVIRGIYGFRGEMLAICVRRPGGARPTRIEAGKGQTLLLFYPSARKPAPEIKK